MGQGMGPVMGGQGGDMGGYQGGYNHQTGAALSAEVMDVARRASRRREENAEQVLLPLLTMLNPSLTLSSPPHPHPHPHPNFR